MTRKQYRKFCHSICTSLVNVETIFDIIERKDYSEYDKVFGEAYRDKYEDATKAYLFDLKSRLNFLEKNIFVDFKFDKQ